MANVEYKVERFGDEQEPVIIIDDFYSDSQALIDFAKSKEFHKNSPFYPGIRAEGDVNYLAERMGLLTQVLRDVFGLERGAKVIECNYSLVTTLPEELMPIQCLPHFDGLDTGRLALLHYLSGAEKGGTAFYRHRATQFETVTADRFDRYKTTLEEEAAEFGMPPKRYFNQSTPQFEQLFKVEARPNRLILYRGVTLHSGYIADDFAFTPDIDLGRLTLNTFLQSK